MDYMQGKRSVLSFVGRLFHSWKFGTEIPGSGYPESAVFRRHIIIPLAVAAISGFGSMAQGIPPMLTSEYDQSYPYDKKCPYNSAAGCGAVAIAQILRYYGMPSHGYGEMSYYSTYLMDSVKVNFEEMKFDWDLLSDRYEEGDFSDASADAVASVVFASGAAMYSNYGSSTSVGNYAKMMYGLQHYLHISPDSRYLQRKYYTTAEWLEMLNGNLSEGHPVFYRGSWKFKGGNVGHMFVIDGRDDDGNYHVNFGHGGRQDKYVDIETINQTGLYPGGRGICYNCEQAMVINCYPTPDHAGYPLQVCMSDESVILNRDKTLQDIEVSLGEDFKLSCRLRNVSHDKTRISFGWWLMKDGDPVTQLSNNSYTLRAGYTFTEPVHIRMHLPSELADGSYELRLYSKSPLAPDWREVWENAPSVVSVLVENGFCRITVPDHHSGDPNLMLADSIEELESDYNKQNRDHIYRVHIVNGTTNNFEDIVRIEVSTDQGDMKYDTVLPIYSQTDTEFHINVPDHIFDLEGKTVQALRAYYYDKDSDAFHEITKDGHLAASLLLTDDTAAVRVYSMNGVLMYESSGSCVSEEYGQFLRTLPKGIYIVKEGKKVRKIAI
ncbi:C10 family peptidase [Lepagella muris]|uniref:Uncharacterized protein n=1 Tax=Lepagella muris TaxID=3032870 RepID=A0AC61RDQ1_9BACT|nr:C10 family peptidase [Lepagella muris]TGY76498.1 hypothetical protein E5331_17920 [Lepagella muris]THG47962.1 hypothetical protein E5984_17010 [Bacteroidales bacterium]TKC64349.1 hypothetical protein E5359_003350 [Bacteroidales bacterium]